MAAAPPRPTIPTLSALDLVIETARLRLRPFTVDDVDALWPYVSDPALPRTMSWAAHADRAETRAWLELTQAELAAGTDVSWAIEHAGALAGCISLDGIRWQVGALRLDRAMLGYWLAPPLWGRGLMSEAAHAVVHFGFATLGLHKIVVSCFEENVGSRRVIEKTGFRLVGRSEDDVWRDGTWHTHLGYELTAPEWPDVHTTMRIARH